MLAEINTFCAAGLHLVPIPPDKGKPTKAPKAVGWNQPKRPNNPKGYSNNAADFANCEGFNIGLAHLPSRTAAFDIDDLNACLTLFDDVGLPIQAWLNDLNRVEIQSGKLNRGKLLFRLPHGVESFNTRQYEHNKTMLFELRNASKTGATVQDVIIGTHPDTGTTYQVIGDIANIPEIPDGLLSVALHWESWRLCFDSALGIGQESPKIAPHKPQQGEQTKGWRDPIKEFSQSINVQSVLIRNGYKPVGKDRFIRPGSSSKAPGVAIMRNCADGVERAYSHGGDVLNNGFSHDAFDCMKLLECDGDLASALNWNVELTKSNQRIFMQEQAKNPPDNCTLATLATSESSVFDWEKPNEIETKTPPVQALQPELIPEPFRHWLADVSHRMQTPPDFAAISSIVIIGSIIGAGCSIRPKKLDDWEIIPNVWGAAIGRPSVVLKSPSMKEPMQLLERLQAEYGEQFERDKAGAEFDMLANKAMLDDVKGQLSKTAKGKGRDGVVKGDDMQKLKADYLELAEKAEPEATRRLFKTNETSVQSMTVLQNQNPRGLLTFRDELTALLVKWDREDGADERAYFLEGWNGNGSYTDFKIGRGLTEAPNICISLLGGIQPDKLRRYLYQAQNGANDGLMQRLQLAVWPDEPEHWRLIDTIPNKAEKQRAFDIMKALAELDFIQCGAIQSDYDDRAYFRFTDAGQAIFNDWLTELQNVKIQQEESPLMVEHFGKFRSLMPSLALIFHCIDIADGKARGNVSVQAARLAVDWCKYLESHARRIYAMAESPEHEAAVRLASKIKAKSLTSPFSAKDIYDKHWHGLKDKQEVEAACNILIDENWLMMTQKPKPATGRPPLPEYQINPVFL